jgi:hypothetical protein
MRQDFTYAGHNVSGFSVVFTTLDNHKFPSR